MIFFYKMGKHMLDKKKKGGAIESLKTFLQVF